MKAKTIYTDEHGPVVSMDDFDILQRSHAELLQVMENILKGRRKGDKERFYWLQVDIEDDYAAEDAVNKAKGL